MMEGEKKRQSKRKNRKIRSQLGLGRSEYFSDSDDTELPEPQPRKGTGMTAMEVDGEKSCEETRGVQDLMQVGMRRPKRQTGRRSVYSRDHHKPRVYPGRDDIREGIFTEDTETKDDASRQQSGRHNTAWQTHDVKTRPPNNQLENHIRSPSNDQGDVDIESECCRHIDATKNQNLDLDQGGHQADREPQYHINTPEVITDDCPPDDVSFISEDLRDDIPVVHERKCWGHIIAYKENGQEDVMCTSEDPPRTLRGEPNLRDEGALSDSLSGRGREYNLHGQEKKRPIRSRIIGA
ncbi:uncharacterized protein LOC135154136 [Lytechinus pictus]|uniref:uncharacterized protein LOC135154136 n=1 Tax=Lytechinus pictus TaxID=7653 RepID=UPI0030BA2822